MPTATQICPCCKQNKEIKVIPFHPKEGISLVCGECFQAKDAAYLINFGMQVLVAADHGGHYFPDGTNFGDALDVLTLFIRHLKNGDAKPFDVADTLVVVR